MRRLLQGSPWEDCPSGSGLDVCWSGLRLVLPSPGGLTFPLGRRLGSSSDRFQFYLIHCFAGVESNAVDTKVSTHFSHHATAHHQNTKTKGCRLHHQSSSRCAVVPQVSIHYRSHRQCSSSSFRSHFGLCWHLHALDDPLRYPAYPNTLPGAMPQDCPGCGRLMGDQNGAGDVPGDYCERCGAKACIFCIQGCDRDPGCEAGFCLGLVGTGVCLFAHDCTRYRRPPPGRALAPSMSVPGAGRCRGSWEGAPI